MATPTRAPVPHLPAFEAGFKAFFGGLEYDTAEQKDLDARFFSPLRAMRNWWKQPKALLFRAVY